MLLVLMGSNPAGGSPDGTHTRPPAQASGSLRGPPGVLTLASARVRSSLGSDPSGLRAPFTYPSTGLRQIASVDYLQTLEGQKRVEFIEGSSVIEDEMR